MMLSVACLFNSIGKYEKANQIIDRIKHGQYNELINRYIDGVQNDNQS